MRPAITNALTNAIKSAFIKLGGLPGEIIKPHWYDRKTGMINPDVVISNFNEVIEWQQ